MEFIKKYFSKLTNNPLKPLLLFYFIFNLINLTALPIYNDESIYLDWGWLETHVPGRLYYSILDGKQPLLMWIFGIFSSIFPDPLWAGRFVSVIVGGIALIGIYKVAKKLFGLKTAVIAGFTYSIIPLFVFYNRQALMEASIAAVGIWTFYYLLNLIEKPTQKDAILLGLVLGLGFFIKTSAIIFILSFYLIAIFLFLKKRQEIFKASIITSGVILIVDFLLLINPDFWATLPSNSRYALSLNEILSFPFSIWLTNIKGFFEIGLLFLTPFIFVVGLIGIFTIFKNKSEKNLIFLSFFLISLFFELLTVKGQTIRYISPFMPFLIVCFSYLATGILNTFKNKIIKWAVLVLFISIPFTFSAFLVLNPISFIQKLSGYSMYADKGYIKGQTSGIGVKEAVNYLTSLSQTNGMIIGISRAAGNPENAINVYMQKKGNAHIGYMEAELIPGIEKYSCFTADSPIYFVTRDEQLYGLDRFFERAISFKNPFSAYKVSVYKAKNNCPEEKTFKLMMVQQNI